MVFLKLCLVIHFAYILMYFFM